VRRRPWHRSWVLATAAALSLCATSLHPAAAGVVAGPPNIVLILLDDADRAAVEAMPNVDALIRQQGMTFDRTYVTLSQCCPSRASILTGEYVHNHKVFGNKAVDSGGFLKFAQKGHERRTFARELRELGYKTGIFGKYLNEYGPATGSSSHRPRYWNRWFLTFDPAFYGYTVNDNGHIRTYGSNPAAYATTVFGQKARRWLNRTAKKQPFMAFASFTAPHEPWTDPPNHRREFANARPPSFSKPSFNERNMSDKPRFYRSEGRISPADKKGIRVRYVHRKRMLLAVDDFVKRLVTDLTMSGELDNTYIFVTSDNGWMQGEHRRIREKAVVYEESVNMPLFVRGPGIVPGSSSSKLVSLLDLFPTFVELAGGATTRDGRSIVPLLLGESVPWRTGLLIQWTNRITKIPGYRAVITDRYKYVVHATKEKELYDLEQDPFELESMHKSADPALVDGLREQLGELSHCRGATCRTADGGPPD
jgi:arylsulfatase A-like enzyme